MLFIHTTTFAINDVKADKQNRLIIIRNWDGILYGFWEEGILILFMTYFFCIYVGKIDARSLFSLPQNASPLASYVKYTCSCLELQSGARG